MRNDRSYQPFRSCSAGFNVLACCADEVESQLRVHPVVGDLTRVPDNELLEGELVLFRVNSMYTVRLKKDGNVIWVVDGVRV